jgi:hypothetical protein
VIQLRIADCGLWIRRAESFRASNLPFQSAIRNAFPLALLMVITATASVSAQQAGTRAEPLRKTDLIRLLSSGAMTATQIAALVERNCVSFTPTTRDRRDLTALGADSTVMASIDACLEARRARTPARPAQPAVAAAAPPTPAPTPAPPPGLQAVPLTTRLTVMAGGTASVGVAVKRGGQAVAGTRLVLRGSGRVGGAGTDAEAVTDSRGIAQFRFPVSGDAGTTSLAVATVGGEPLSQQAAIELITVVPAPPPVPVRRPAAERTGFALGSGQRGRVGQPAALPVVFEVRDSTGAPLPDVAVALSITNGRLQGAAERTDSAGQVRATVIFGDRAGVPTVVTGTVGAITRQATLEPSPGTPSRLVVLSDGNALTGQLVVLTARPAELRVYCRDALGNTVPLAGLRATVGDDHVVRVTDVTSDSLGGSVTITATGTGSTNLVIQGSGLRADFSALVRP